MAAISFRAEHFDLMSAHLNELPESIAFMLCEPPGDDGLFRVVEVQLIGAGGLASQGVAHCELDDAIRADLIKEAWDSGRALVEVHSHGLLFPPRFSSYDLTQLEVWVPHVRWRLRGRPYAALVTASQDIDGLAWIGDQVEPIEQILVDGREPKRTTGFSFADWRSSDAR